MCQLLQGARQITTKGRFSKRNPNPQSHNEQEFPNQSLRSLKSQILSLRALAIFALSRKKQMTLHRVKTTAVMYGAK